jgi:ribosomal protein S18 acetylase RimI-like enzyme
MRIRPVSGSSKDRLFLREMLYEAAAWRPGPEPAPETVLSDPSFARYVAAWGRRGDTGVIAEDEEGLLGAAWYRLFPATAPGFGFVDPHTPEVSVAVRASARGRGIGTALLSALIELARAERFAALSLSVERDNPALRLYRRVGFTLVEECDGALTMRLDLG